MAHLNIGGSSSSCGSCGYGANPNERGHFTRVGYGVEPGTPGCGEPWTSASLTYWFGEQDIAERIENSWFPPFTKRLLREFHLKED